MKAPNKINAVVADTDKFHGTGKSVKALALEMMHSLEYGCPYHTTFLENIPHESKSQAEQELKYHFEIWANTWIAPKLRQIIAKSK